MGRRTEVWCSVAEWAVRAAKRRVVVLAEAVLQCLIRQRSIFEQPAAARYWLSSQELCCRLSSHGQRSFHLSVLLCRKINTQVCIETSICAR